MRLPVLIGYCCWTLTQAANAQEFGSRQYTVREGLSSDDVRCLALDSAGFLWVGTADGLNRFDGNSFQAFTHDPADSSSIGGNLIQGFFVDSKRQLWVGTKEGVSLYHPGEQRFTNFAPDTGVLSNIGLDFQAFGEDTEGRLWVGTKNDLLLLDPAGGTWSSSGWGRFADRVVPTGGNRLRVVVLGIRPKGPGEFWVWTTFGLFSVSTADRIFRYYPSPYPVDYDYYGSQMQYVDARGNPWFSLYAVGLMVYDTVQKTWTTYRTPDSLSAAEVPTTLRPYRGDTLVYGTANNLLFFNSAQRRVIYHSRLFSMDAAIRPAVSCRDVLTRGDICWAATNHGLVKMVPHSSQFDYQEVPGMNLVSRVHRSSAFGAFVFGAPDGAWVVKDGSAPQALLPPGGKAIIAHHLYWLELPALHEACFNGEEGFFVWDAISGRVRQIRWPDKRNLHNDISVRNMVADRNGLVWLRTLDQGIYCFDPRTDSLWAAMDLPDGATKQLSFLYYDSLSHCIWVAEEFNGVYVYDIAKRAKKHYLLNTPPSQRGAGVICISGDGKGNICMADVVSGIITYSSRTGKFNRYTNHDGLLSDNTIWNCADGHGRLWISTDLGLSCMDTTTRFINYFTSEGYPVTEGGFISRDAGGRLYMPWRNGYYSWRPTTFAARSLPGRLYLRKFQVSGLEQPYGSGYRIPAGENTLQLRLGWLSLEEDIPPPIEYRLNDGPWLTAGVSSMLSFTNLGAGRYTITARAKNHPGEPLRLEFAVARHFWRSPWFIGALLLAVAAVLIWANRARIGRVRKDALLRQQVMESEMATLRSQMNPHFVFNTLNSINSYIIENKTQQASDYLTDFSRLMRIILDHSRMKQVTLEEELRTVRLYLELESRRLEAGFDYRIDVVAGLDMGGIYVPPLIIQPFVENAIWHGLRHRRSAGHIDIRLQAADEQLQISVTDNGIGRQAAGKLQRNWRQSSFGTAATIRRIRLADPASEVLIDDLYGSEGDARGTRVTLLLHLKTVSYAG